MYYKLVFNMYEIIIQHQKTKISYHTQTNNKEFYTGKKINQFFHIISNNLPFKLRYCPL